MLLWKKKRVNHKIFRVAVLNTLLVTCVHYDMYIHATDETTFIMDLFSNPGTLLRPEQDSASFDNNLAVALTQILSNTYNGVTL